MLSALLPARALVLGAILATSAVLQFYRINDWQTFSDDQASQLRVMHGLLVEHHVPLLGLALSVGSAHIGPLFYYLLALPLALGQALVGYLDPTAGVVLIGLFQVATVYLLYRLCVLVGAPWAGLCAAALYATSQLVVYWSRFLWPNIAPFFVVLALYALVALALPTRDNSATPAALRPLFLLLAGSLAAAAQLQPTAVLLLPVALIWLLAIRPRLTLRLVLLAGALVVLLFAPVIVYDLTHRFAETRAWLGYGTTLRPHAAPANGIGRGLGELERFGWQAVGFRTRAWVDRLLGAAALAVFACAAGLGGRSRAVLARLLLLWAAVYLLGFALYHGALHPHYVEPLYPLPFLAIGLLLDFVVTAPLRLRATRAFRIGLGHHRLRMRVALILGAGTAALVAGLVTANVRHLWADQFGLDAFQLDSPAALPGNRLMLGEMRRAAGLIARSAAGEPYSFLLAVRDGAGGSFAYLQRQTSAPPAIHLQAQQFLLVEPADRPPWLWPAATRLRWSGNGGGFVRLPHLLLWRIRLPSAHPAALSGPWQSAADTAGEATALAALAGGDSRDRAGSPTGDGRIIAGYIGGAATLEPPGHVWRRAAWPAGPNGRAVISAFAWSPACPQHLYAATFDGVLTSPDGGGTWRPTPEQPASPEILSLLADPRRCARLLAGTRAGIARTDDGGRHWRHLALGGRRHLAVHALSADPANGLIYAGTTDGVWVSSDGGWTWPPRRLRHEPRPALSLLLHPGGAPLLLVGSGAGVVASGDGGRTWTPIGGSPHAAVYALLDVDGRGTLLAGTDAGLYVSHNDGRYWQPATLPAGIAVKALVLGPRHVVFAGSSQGVYRSTDGGTTWQPL